MQINYWVSRLGVTLLVCSLAALASCSGKEGGSLAVELGSGDDRLPNLTASEVVTFADHMVVAEVVSEKALPVPQEDIERGEGLILRDVTFRVVNTVWSNAESIRAMPDAFNWTAIGWSFKDSVDNRTLGGYEGSPRFEKGRTYILALDWAQENCSEPGRWSSLGGSFNMPYEEGVIGVGELEGRSISKDRVLEERPTQGIRAEAWGKDLAALKDALERAKSDPVLAKQMASAEKEC
ncbi:MAG: hypothetical protein ACRCYU_22300 [Nocardioides sp.]